MNRKTSAFLAVMILAGAAWAFYAWRYPFGWSHCCDKQLYFALATYANEHGGVFPNGGKSPEASLSQLYPVYADASLLCGKTVSRQITQAKLQRDGTLSEDTCDWHYVEGLRKDDDPNIAIIWDKIGLGHNGERLPNGGHTVVFVSGNVETIPQDRWQQFLEEQDALRARQKTKR